MVVEPDRLLARYVEAGCELVIVHAEACTHLHRTLGLIRDLGARSGVALNPHTPADVVAHVLHETDLVLAMTVNPGFGGQEFIATSVEKIARARAMLDAAASNATLEVDGGINRETLAKTRAAGADTFVAGNAIFSAKEPQKEIEALRAAGAARA